MTRSELRAFRAAVKFNRTPNNLVNLAVSLMRFAIRGESPRAKYLDPAVMYMREAGKIATPQERQHVKDNWAALEQSCNAMKHPIKPAADGAKEIAPPPQRKAPVKRTEYPRAWMTHQRSVPPAPPFPRVSVEALSYNTPLLERRQPFVLTGAMDGWKDIDLHTTAQRWSDAVADFHPHNMLDRESKALYLVRYGRGLEQLTAEPHKFGVNPAAPEGRYLHLQLTPKMWRQLEEAGELPSDRHAQLHGDEWMESCMTPEIQEEYHIKTHWKILITGTQGAGMFNHTDSLQTSSWHAQLTGRKWWYVCKGGECMETIAEPGDVVYYGEGWWHETENLETPTSTLTGTVIHQHNWKRASQRLFRECVNNEMSFRFSSQLCDSLDKCRKQWYSDWSQETDPLGSWRDAATAATVATREKTEPHQNNYDGSNYITE